MNNMIGKCLPQDWLRAGGSLADLEHVYGVKSKRGEHYKNLVSLKYSMIDSPLGDPLVQQCRGLILDESKNWNIVARPFDKFFNLGEPNAATVKWPCQVQEKLDGSLVVMYFYDGLWRVGTSGTPDAMGPVGAVGAASAYTFGGLFWWVFNVLKMERPDERWKNWTFMFELMTRYNRVVCSYGENRITFLGARGADAEGEELSPDEFPCKSHGWKSAKSFPLKTIGDILNTFRDMKPLEQEGYVLCDADFNRVKIKHPGYVALHHLKGNGFNQKRILEVVRSGETKEILASFPEWTTDFAKVQHAYASLAGELLAEYAAIKDIPVQKTFAYYALMSKCSDCLFALRNGKTLSVKSYLQNMNLETLLVLLQVR